MQTYGIIWIAKNFFDAGKYNFNPEEIAKVTIKLNLKKPTYTI